MGGKGTHLGIVTREGQNRDTYDSRKTGSSDEGNVDNRLTREIQEE